MTVNRGSRKSLLTVRERVILHLLAQHKFCQDADAPKVVTQDGIASAIEVGRNNVAKIMTTMSDEGLVDIQSKHVKGLPSVRLVYFLAPKGFEEGKKLKASIESTMVEVIDLNGETHPDEVGRLGVYLPNRYSLLELAMGITRGVFDTASFHEGKVKEERRFVDYSDKKPAIRTFYGREQELEKLYGLIGSRTIKAVMIYGIPGIGKTTLLAKFTQDIRDRINVFWFKVHEWVDYKGVLKPLSEFLSQIGKKNLEYYLTQTDIPVLGEVCHIIETDMKGTNSLLIFDDIHKSDKGVKELLGAILTSIESITGTWMIGSAREMQSFYDRGAVFRGFVVEMQLDGLDRDSSFRMMRTRSLPEVDLESLFSITNGHPLFLELIEDPKLALGKNIRMFIEQEVFSRLDVSERRIMGIAAIFRYPVMIDAFFSMEEEIQNESRGVVAELEPSDYTISYETVDSLISKSILHESVGRMIGMHDLMREFVYSRLTPRQRNIYHKAAARFYLQDKSAPSSVEALYHCLMAKEYLIAIDIAAGNGRNVINRGYAVQFSPLLKTLLSSAPRIEQRDRMEILSLQGEIMEVQGEWDAAISRFSEIIGMASSTTDVRLLAEMNRRIGAINLRRSRLDDSAKYLDTALDLAQKANEKQTLAEVFYDLGGVWERRGKWEEAYTNFSRSMELSKLIGDEASLGKSMYGLAQTLDGQHRFDESIITKKEVLRILERSGDITMISKVSTSLGNDLRQISKFEEANEYQETAVKLARMAGDLNTLGFALANSAAIYIEEGNWLRGEEMIDSATSIFKKLNDLLMLSTLHLYRGYLYAKKGDWEWAKVEFKDSIDIIRSVDMPVRLSEWLYQVAQAYIDNNDGDQALQLLQEAYKVAESVGHEKLMKDAMNNIERMCTVQ
jgi:tetratricopeptide (TPR) repeat protein